MHIVVSNSSSVCGMEKKKERIFYQLNSDRTFFAATIAFQTKRSEKDTRTEPIVNAFNGAPENMITDLFRTHAFAKISSERETDGERKRVCERISMNDW